MIFQDKPGRTRKKNHFVHRSPVAATILLPRLIFVQRLEATTNRRTPTGSRTLQVNEEENGLDVRAPEGDKEGTSGVSQRAENAHVFRADPKAGISGFSVRFSVFFRAFRGCLFHFEYRGWYAFKGEMLDP